MLADERFLVVPWTVEALPGRLSVHGLAVLFQQDLIVGHVLASPARLVGSQVVLEDQVHVQDVPVGLGLGAQVTTVHVAIHLPVDLLAMTGK